VASAIGWARGLPAAPLVCATLNFAAALVMAFVLAPATPLVADAAERVAYVQTHLLAWKLGWSVWIAAALSLLWFYAWWGGGGRASSLPPPPSPPPPLPPPPPPTPPPPPPPPPCAGVANRCRNGE
jgi:hypothetical protein